MLCSGGDGVTTTENIEAAGFSNATLLDLLEGLPGPYATARHAMKAAMRRIADARRALTDAETELRLIRRAVAHDLGRCADAQIGAALSKAMGERPITMAELT